MTFFSEGQRVAGLMRLPDDHSGRLPAVVQGPGWLQLKEAKRNVPYHEALTAAGFAVLAIDFRGFGDSEGDGTDLSPVRWLEDLVASVTYLTTRDDVDTHAIGTFGSGSTGGSNAVTLAAVDQRVRCAVAQVPIADGTDWLRRMRREHEWIEFCARIEEDRRRRVLTGSGELVHPRTDIMVKTPARRAREATGNVEDQHVRDVSLHSAEAIMAYRPVDAAHRVRNLLVIGVEDDPVTPTDHALMLYERAHAPKKLILQRNTTHYAAYEDYAGDVVPEIVDWFRHHLTGGSIEVWDTTSAGEARLRLERSEKEQSG